jgi:ABC-type Fe3+-siderophore transport system permease subunit
LSYLPIKTRFYLACGNGKSLSRTLVQVVLGFAFGALVTLNVISRKRQDLKGLTDTSLSQAGHRNLLMATSLFIILLPLRYHAHAELNVIINDKIYFFF